MSPFVRKEMHSQKLKSLWTVRQRTGLGRKAPKELFCTFMVRLVFVHFSKCRSDDDNLKGGAYCVPATPGTFEYIFQMIELLEKERKDVACLFLSYGQCSCNNHKLFLQLIEPDLAPTRTYPRQLAQAAILLNYTLNTLSYEPSDILLAGDSAGGNLALALLSHIVHPHPDQSVPQVKLPGPEKLHSVALLSPWVDFSTSTAGSFYVNRYQDLFGPGTLKRWSDAFLYGDIKEVRKDGKEDSYNEPIGADADWWEGVKDVVDSVCIVAGGRELFLDCR